MERRKYGGALHALDQTLCALVGACFTEFIRHGTGLVIETGDQGSELKAYQRAPGLGLWYRMRTPPTFIYISWIKLSLLLLSSPYEFQ